MRSACLSVVLAAALAAPLAADDIGPGDPLHSKPQDASEELKGFHLPPGFAIQLVASEPEIQKPLNMSFDRRGRLFVSHTVEYPFAAKDPATARDGITVLSDFAEDGHARKAVRFADHLSIPIGVVPIGDDVIAYSIPRIWRFSDQHDDAVAAKREAIYSEFGFVDCHGMANSFTRWIDGWVYGNHGFKNASTVAGADKQAITMTSGNTYRFRTDGSHIEHWGIGQVNPHGITFDALGNLFNGDCHTKPITLVLRGACYPEFGRPHDGLGFAPNIMSHSHGSTGLSGPVYYEADYLPAECRGEMFVCNPVTGRVNRDHLTWHGSSPTAVATPDFIWCDDTWFRPVTLQLGPDGALYLSDFYNCIIGHYEVPLTHPLRDRTRGRIWRIVATGADGKPLPLRPMPDLTTLAPPALAALLTDPNLTVRTLATNELVDRGAAAGDAVVAALSGSAASQRAHALWAAERLGRLDDATLEKLAGDGDRLVRTHVMRLLAERPQWTMAQSDLVRARLDDADAFVRRTAADALGRHPDAADLAPLLAAWAKTPGDDAQLLHTLKMAVRDQFAAAGAAPALTAIAEGDAASADRLGESCLGATGPTAGEVAFARLRRGGVDDQHLEGLVQHAARHLADDRLPAFIQQLASYHADPPPRQGRMLIALAKAMQVRGAPLPADLAAWAETTTVALLAAGDEGQVRIGIELAKLVRPAAAREALTKLAANDGRFEKLRKPAGEALAGLPASAAAATAKPATPAAPAIDRPALIAQRLAGFAKAKPDVAHGQQVFAINCAVCHRIADVGGEVGPSLDGIGIRGAEQVATDVLDPNRAVDPRFFPTLITTKDGRSLTLASVRTDGQVLIGLTAAGESRVPLADIANREVLKISPMPEALALILGEQDFYDLLGFLMTKREAPAKKQ